MKEINALFNAIINSNLLTQQTINNIIIILLIFVIVLLGITMFTKKN